MLLSIGMIIKNEEENLPRCLDGIKSLLDIMNGEAELIVTDTGSTDRSVEIVKKYTDNIIHFEWCNDFAAARNTSLDAATGEWYMFLDADEVLIDPVPLADFFLSGEYRSFHSATLSFRNYSDVETDSYSVFYAPRLTRKNPATKFIGAVHERFSDYSVPVKQIEARVDHFGYVNDPDDILARKKFERNYPILLKELEKDPDTIITYIQLAEATVRFEPEKSLEYLEMGIEVAKRKKDFGLYVLYCKRIRHLAACNRLEEALKYAEEYTSTPHEPMGTDIEVMACKGYLLFTLKRYAEAIDAYSTYIRLYNEFRKGRLRTADTLMTSMTFISENRMLGCVNNAVISAIRTKKFNTAKSLLKNLPLKNHIGNTAYMHIRIKQELIIMKGLGNYNGTAALLSELKDPVCRQSFFNSLLPHIVDEKDGEKTLNAILKQNMPSSFVSAAKILTEAKGTLSDERRIALIKELKEILKTAPELKSIVKYIADNHLRLLPGAESQAKKSEFEMLALTVKDNIRKLINDGRDEEAAKMLSEYEKLCPDDDEITDFRISLGITEKENFLC